jgi:diguanylate cyclase (GGDEF)-like protein
VREGRSASPLTGLPGNAAIRAELERRLRARQPFGLLYADIDSFKPYNDHYGFLRGDHVLRTLGDVLRTVARERPDAFVGHIGGDDFAVLTGDPVAFAEQVLTAFHDVAPRFYDERDARRGWIPGKDRRGRRVRWPLLTVSIGIARSVPDEQRDALALVDVATEMKGVAKRSPGSAIALDRRSSDAGIPRPSRPPRSAAQIVRNATGGVVASLMVVALALPSLVAAAGWAQPDDRLWGAKLVTEDVRLLLAGDPQARAEVHLSIAADRLAAALLDPGPAPELLLDDLDAHVRAARALSDDLPPAAAARIRVALDRQVLLIDAVSDQRARASDG